MTGGGRGGWQGACLPTDLLVADGEFALGLLVALCESLQLFDRLALKNRHAKFDVRLGVLVARLHSCGRHKKSAFSILGFSTPIA